MAPVKQFRTALRGFHREDVIHYIEYLNNQHANTVAQLSSQLQNARSQAPDPALQEKLSAAEARIAELEAKLAAVPAVSTEQELEAYRRAESAERVARERAQEIYAKANAVLADVTLKAEAAASAAGSAADQIAAQLDAYRQSVTATQEALSDAVATLYAIRPNAE